MENLSRKPISHREYSVQPKDGSALASLLMEDFGAQFCARPAPQPFLGSRGIEPAYKPAGTRFHALENLVGNSKAVELACTDGSKAAILCIDRDTPHLVYPLLDSDNVITVAMTSFGPDVARAHAHCPVVGKDQSRKAMMQWITDSTKDGVRELAEKCAQNNVPITAIDIPKTPVNELSMMFYMGMPILTLMGAIAQLSGADVNNLIKDSSLYSTILYASPFISRLSTIIRNKNPGTKIKSRHPFYGNGINQMNAAALLGIVLRSNSATDNLDASVRKWIIFLGCKADLPSLNAILAGSQKSISVLPAVPTFYRIRTYIWRNKNGIPYDGYGAWVMTENQPYDPLNTPRNNSYRS